MPAGFSRHRPESLSGPAAASPAALRRLAMSASEIAKRAGSIAASGGYWSRRLSDALKASLSSRSAAFRNASKKPLALRCVEPCPAQHLSPRSIQRVASSEPIIGIPQLQSRHAGPAQHPVVAQIGREISEACSKMADVATSRRSMKRTTGRYKRTWIAALIASGPKMASLADWNAAADGPTTIQSF